MRYAASFALLIALTGCFKKQDRTWNAILPTFGNSIVLSEVPTYTAAYVGRQTHEPYFRFDENRQVTSKVLVHYESTIDFKAFVLCPDTRLRFSESEFLTATDVQSSLSRLKPKSNEIVKTEFGDCVRAEFAKPNRRFFQTLSEFSYAASRASKDPRFTLGLGPFAIKSFTDSQIVLERKPWTQGRFDRIELVAMNDLRKENIPAGDFEDFNMLAEPWLPEKVTKTYQQYSITKNALTVLMLHMTDERLRQRIFHCVDIGALREISFYSVRDPLEVATLLPLGIRGAKAGLPLQNCPSKPMNYSGRPLRLLNYFPERHSQMAAYAQRLSKRTGIPIEVKAVDAKQVVQMVAEDKAGYDLAIIALTGEHWTAESFLENFFGETKMHRYTPGAWEREFEEVLGLADPAERDRRAIALADKVMKAAFALPVGQLRKMLYYPKELSVPFGGNSYEYPEVDKIK